MKLKHTRGPWTPAIYKTTDSMLERLKTPQWSVALNDNPKESEGLLIALCGDGDDKQSMADAHLIAAAPEMVELLDELLEDLNSIIDNNKEWGRKRLIDHCFDIQTKITEVIAKAEGRSK